MSSSTVQRVLRMVLVTIVLGSSLMLYGCDSWFDEDIFSYLERTLDEWAETGDEEEEAVTEGDVELAITMPVGAMNTIKISVEVDGMTYVQQLDVSCVSPAGYACVGDQSMCPKCSHGCPACPHATVGPITTGSPNVHVRGRPAARVGDTGVAAACCGPNTF